MRKEIHWCEHTPPSMVGSSATQIKFDLKTLFCLIAILFLISTVHLVSAENVTPEPLPDVIHILSSCDSILWVIPDTGKPFGGTQIWRDAVYQYNLSNTTYYDSWTGLVEGTVYSISTRAYSINGGSFDKDWYNATAQTACCECAGLGGGCCGCGDSTGANILAFAPASLLVGVVGGYVLGKGEK